MTNLDGHQRDELCKELLIPDWAEQQIEEPTAADTRSGCVIYCRFSTTGQNEETVETQTQYCRVYAKRNAYELAPGRHRYVDRAKSGYYVEPRSALAQLRADAAAGKFNKILIYDLDRLSRRLSHLLMLYEEFTALGIEVHVTGVSGIGRVDDVKAVFYGLFAMEQRLKLLRQTGQAIWTAAVAGRNMGGIPYGYRRGRKAGELVVHKAEARIVRLIFDHFASGLNARQIAFLLNKDGVPSPTGKEWNAATIAGQRGLGSGILRNPKYVGVYVFGKKRIITSADGCKKRYRIRPRRHWIMVETPGWAIVDRRVWVRVALRLKKWSESLEQSKPREKHSNKSILLFHGLLECSCGAPMYGVFSGKSRIRKLQCKAACEFGTCPNKRETSSIFVEIEILREIRDRILSREAVEAFAVEYIDELKRAREEDRREAERLRRRIADLESWIAGSLVESLTAGCAPEDVVRTRETWTKERDALAETLADMPTAGSAPDLDRHAASSLRGRIDCLIRRMPLLATTREDMLLVLALRGLIERVVVHRGPRDEGYTLHISSTLARLSTDIMDDEMSYPVRTVERICPRPTKGIAMTAELDAFLADQAARNLHGLTDADWEALKPLLSGWTRPDQRRLIEAALFYLRTGRGLANLPAPFDARTVAPAVRRMVWKGWWTKAYDTLTSIGSPAVAGLDVSPFTRLAALPNPR
jgi:DNA invertase Pin-like site-specific DNA recombinase/DNA-dependent RNA polymerase auxiliary subunit epsilon